MVGSVPASASLGNGPRSSRDGLAARSSVSRYFCLIFSSSALSLAQEVLIEGGIPLEAVVRRIRRG